MGCEGDLGRGRAAFAEERYGDAFELLSAADGHEDLEPEDLQALAATAYLTGRDAEAISAWQRAHHAFIDSERPAEAARCGYWLSFAALVSGDGGQANGWLARIERLLEGHPGCAERGLPLLVTGVMRMGGGDGEGALAHFDRALAIHEHFNDPDLFAFALLGRGQALIQLKRRSEGLRQLDEAMIAVTADEVSPMAAGIIYCAVILTCQRIFDLERCREWTLALNRWCEAHPDAAQFRGRCLLHRSEILQLQGAWSEAMDEAVRASEWFAERGERAAGAAYYQRGELHRLRGELEQAKAMYREAAEAGMDPQPGLSSLRLAEGKVDAARVGIARAVSETGDRQGPGGDRPRPMVLAPYVSIMIEAGDLDAARRGVEELAEEAARIDTPYITALSAEAEGALRLVEGEPSAALAALRRAWAAWQKLEAPYESAKVRVMIADACDELGDHDTAQTHRESAARVFSRLGAKAMPVPSVAPLVEPPSPLVSRLTEREREVLGLVATGMTNRQIAADLCISEHTVARHMSNIFDKLNVTTRTAAAAIALGREPD